MFALVRPFLPYLISGVLALTAVSGVYLYVRQQGVNAEREKQYKLQIENYKKSVEKANAVATVLESNLAAVEATNRQLNKRLNNELSKDPVYRECVVPADGLRLLNEAIANTASAR